MQKNIAVSGCDDCVFKGFKHVHGESWMVCKHTKHGVSSHNNVLNQPTPARGFPDWCPLIEGPTVVNLIK